MCRTAAECKIVYASKQNLTWKTRQKQKKHTRKGSYSSSLSCTGGALINDELLKVETGPPESVHALRLLPRRREPTFEKTRGADIEFRYRERVSLYRAQTSKPRSCRGLAERQIVRPRKNRQTAKSLQEISAIIMTRFVKMRSKDRARLTWEDPLEKNKHRLKSRDKSIKKARESHCPLIS